MIDLTHATLLTIAVMAGAVTVASAVGIPIGLAVHSMPRSPRRAVVVLLAVAAVTPHYVAAAGWEAVWGKFGFIPLTQVAGNLSPGAGYGAVVWIHGICGAAWVALGIAYFRPPGYQAILDSARMDSRMRDRLLQVELPLAGTGLLVGATFTAIRAASEFTVANLYGVITLADAFYLQYAYEPRSVPIVLALLVPLLVLATAIGFAFRVPSSTDPAVAGSPARGHSLLAAIIGLGGAAVLIGIPAVATIGKLGWVVAFEAGEAHAAFSLWEAITRFFSGFYEFRRELAWTAALCACVIALSVPILLGVALSTTSVRPQLALLGLFAFLASIPGPIIAIFWIHVFNRSDPAWLGWLYDRSLLPTAVAVACPVLFPVFAVLVFVRRQLGGQLIEAARVDGASRSQQIGQIELPLLWPAIAFAAGTAAAFTVMDLSISIMIRPPQVETVSTRLFGLLHSGVRQQEAALTLCLWATVATLVVCFGIGAAAKGNRRLE